MKKNVNYYAVAVIVPIILIAVVIAGSILYTTITRPKADYDGFKSAVSTYIQNVPDIKEIKILDDNIFKVTVSDRWYNSSEVEKLRFCKSVQATVYNYASQYKLIYGDNAFVSLDFFDVTGINVAEQDMMDFKILH